MAQSFQSFDGWFQPTEVDEHAPGAHLFVCQASRLQGQRPLASGFRLCRSTFVSGCPRFGRV